MKVAFYTLGCKLNQAETESLAGQFGEAGFALTPPDDVADIYIANTCTVTHIADRKSRHWLRLARRRNPEAFIIATGCYAQRAPQELAPIANLVLDNEEKEHLLEIVEGLSLPNPPSGIGSTSLSHRDIPLRYCEPFAFCHSEGEKRPKNLAQDKLREAIPHSHNTRIRSLIKIQDGCRSPCTYCIVPRVRSHEYSLPASQIIGEIKEKVAMGYKEVILTGTKVGCYKDAVLSRSPEQSEGTSEGSGANLGDLVQRILCDTGIKRLRLSSLQPQEICPEFLALWQDAFPSQSPGRSERTSEGSRLCRHFHLALQSGSDTVLQKMKPRYSLGDYRGAIGLIREAIPAVAITTDIMVGFPGESDEEFEQSYFFCQQAGFANIHVFPFSPRPGTAAARMSNQVKEEVKKERSRRMLELSWTSRRNFEEQFLGQTMLVLWEKETNPGSGIYSGLTDNYIRVFVQSQKPLTNKIAPVKLAGFHKQGMWGELVNENPS